MRTCTVVAIGDLVADIVTAILTLPIQPGAHQVARSVAVEPGGSGNFLVAGARLGMQMRALGAVGNDEIGDIIAHALEAEGVDLSCVTRRGTTTTVISLVDDLGQHVFLGAYGEGPRVELTEDWRQSIQSADAVFTSGYTLLEERLADIVMDSLREARHSSVPVFFDSGWHVADLGEAERQAVLEFSDVLLATAEELPLMTAGCGGAEGARAVLRRGPSVVVMKQGADGCTIYSRDHDPIVSPAFPVIVHDMAAAGDCFDAAFIYGYLNQWPLPQTAQFANAMGAAKVQKLGTGRHVPTEAEVRAVLHKYNVKLDL